VGVEYVEHVGRLTPDLASELGSFGSLEDVMYWMQRRGVALRSMQRVALDEYSNDVFFPLSDRRWLVFGCT
jgi:hypothetical protein